MADLVRKALRDAGGDIDKAVEILVQKYAFTEHQARAFVLIEKDEAESEHTRI